MANRSPASFGHALVGSVGATFVQAGSHDRLGRGVRARGSFGELARKRTRGLVEALVGEHPVDHVPALERGGVVQLAGHHQLARSRRPGTLCEALGATHRGRQAHDGLDEPEARRLGGQQDVAAKRELERRRQAQRVRGEHGGQRQLLDTMDKVEQAHPHRGGVFGAETVEDVYVHATADDSTLAL